MKKPTIKDIERFVKKNSWFDVDDDGKGFVNFVTRENGDMGGERPGREDVMKARSLAKGLKAKYGNAITVEVDYVDEWTNLDVSLEEGVVSNLGPDDMRKAVQKLIPGSEYDKKRWMLVLPNGTEVIFAKIGRGSSASSSMAVYRAGKMVKDIPIKSPKDAARKLTESTSELLNRLEETTEDVLTEGMGGQIVVLDKKSDIEFILDPTNGSLQIGMGGEWWTGNVKQGKNVFRHRKERVDPGYAPVKVVMKDKGDSLSFDISGGFGNEGTIVIGGTR